MVILARQLKNIYVYAPMTRILKYIDYLNEHMKLYDINNVHRVRMFIAQVGHESAQLKSTTENLNYSASGLLKVFGKYFNEETAKQYAHKPQEIANVVYANRMGNGDAESNDGWKYIARGLLGITGKDNYLLTSKELDVSFITCPELLSEPEYAVKSACMWWKRHGLNELADTCNIEKCTKRINGGLNGIEDREILYDRSKKYIL